MVLSLHNVARELLNDEAVQVRYIYSNITPKYWVLTKDIDIELSTGTRIVIPAGFTTDFCTVPKLLWGLFPPYGDFLLASIIHDYLYIHRPYTSRALADKEMLLWSKALNGDRGYDRAIKYYWKRFDNYLRYWCVRAFGWSYWQHIFNFSTRKKYING